MALYGSSRDINLFKTINNELMGKIIQQLVGYYKIDLNKTDNNIYNESLNKIYNDPVLIECLIERNPQSSNSDEFGGNVGRNMNFRFLRSRLVETKIFPEIGDIILWEDDFYEVDNLIENQLIVGKNPTYSYDESTDNFGGSWSIIAECHYTRPEKVGIVKSR